MELKRKYAPIIHTGFGNTYTKESMELFVKTLDELGYSGFSAEGKSAEPTTDIDGWINGYMNGIKYACEESEKRGTDVWIFDEWGYPTGTAAGKTMQDHPEWRSKKLHCAADIILEEGETVSITVPKHFLAAAAWHVNRNIFASPAGGYEVVPVVDGKLTYTATHRRCRFVAASWEYDNTRTVGVFVHDQENDAQCTLDLLCKEAVAKLLSVMHEEYYSRMPEFFGKVIKGFFYDEPFLSFPLPYTFDIIEEFIAEKGYDPTEKLPLIVSGGGGNVVSDYRDVCTTRMAKAFFGGMAEWCHAHGVELVGHQDLDHDIRSLNSVSGDFFKNNKYNDAPGVDYIWAQLRPDHTADFPRFAGSFRRMKGKAHATSESFAATGLCLTPDYMRWAMEYQVLRGIDRFYLMIAEPDFKNGKGFGTPLDFNHPLSKNYMKYVNRHVNTVNQLVNESSPKAEVAVYVPRRELASEYPPARANRVSLHMPWEWVNETVDALLYAPVDFDYIWDEVIIENETDEEGSLLVPSGQKIKTVIVPAVGAFSPDVAQKLHEMQEKGAKIVFVSFAAEGFVGSPVCTHPENIADYIDRDVKIRRGRVSVTVRRDEIGEVYYFLNDSEKAYSSELDIEGAEHLHVFDLDDLTWHDASEEEKTKLELAPLELKIYRSSASPIGKEKEKAVLCGELYDWKAEKPNGETVYMGNSPYAFESVDYTGITKYSCKVRVPTDGTYVVSLGKICYAATVTFDGNTDEKIPVAFAPFTAKAELCAGEHSMEIEVLNADAASVLGSPEAETKAREERRFKTIFENDRDYISAGIDGPVALYEVL